MSLPQFKVAGALANATAGTTLTTVIPTGTAPGEGMILALMHNAASGFTTPTNWILIGTVVNNSGGSFAFFSRKYQAGDANPQSTVATMSATVAGYGRIYVFRNVDASATWYEDAVLTVVSGTPTTSTTPTRAATVTTGVDRLAIGLATVDDDNTWSSGMPPSLWHQIGLVSTTTGGDAMMDGIWRPSFVAETIASNTIGTMSASDVWRTLSAAIIGGTDLSVRHYQVAASTTTPKVSQTIEWGAGDRFIVCGSMENNTILLDTPTVSGSPFTFSQTSPHSVGPVDNPTDTGPGLQLWEAQSSSAGSGTISMARNAGSISTNYGMQIWVISGDSVIGAVVMDLNESQLSLGAVVDDCIIIYEMIDWNATAAGKTETATNGYLTERVDILNTGYSVASCDVVDVVAAGSYSIGMSSYTGLNVAQFAVVIELDTGAAPVNVDGAIGVFKYAGIGGTLSLTGINVPGSVGTFKYVGVAGSPTIGVQVQGAVGTYVATGVAGTASLSSLNVQGATGVGVWVGIAGDVSLGIAPVNVQGAIGVYVGVGVGGAISLTSINVAGSVGIYNGVGVNGAVSLSVIGVPGSIGIFKYVGVSGTVSLSAFNVAGSIGTYRATGVAGTVAFGALNVQGSIGVLIFVGIAGNPDAGIPMPVDVPGAIGVYRGVGVAGTTLVVAVAHGSTGTYRFVGISGAVSLTAINAVGARADMVFVSLPGSIVLTPLALPGAVGTFRALGISGNPFRSSTQIVGSIAILRMIGIAATILGQDIPVRAGAFRVEGFAYEDMEVEGMYVGDQLIF